MNKSNAFVLEIDLQHFAFETEKEFRGLTISKKEDHWNVVIRGTDKGGVKLYAITQGDDLNETIQELSSVLMSKEAHYVWRLDSWAKD